MIRCCLLAALACGLSGCGIVPRETLSWGAYVGKAGTILTPHLYQQNQGPTAIAPLGGGSNGTPSIMPTAPATIYVQPSARSLPLPRSDTIETVDDCTTRNCCERLDRIERSLGKLLHFREARRMPDAD